MSNLQSLCPLIWRRVRREGDRECFVAKAPFDLQYEVDIQDNDHRKEERPVLRYEAILFNKTYIDVDWDQFGFKTREDAMRACQKHYNKTMKPFLQ